MGGPPAGPLGRLPLGCSVRVMSRQVQSRWGLVAAGWSVYALYYLGRVNFSVAVPGLEDQLGYTPTQIGAMAAGFFWVYSLSVAPIGRLADRIGTRSLVGVGLVGTGLLNLLFVTAGSFAWALPIWSANGIFQAMGWTPLLGGLRRWLPPEKAGRVIASFGSCFVAGTALTFAVGGWIVDRSGPEQAFLVAALVLIPLGAVWLLAVRDPVGPPPPRQSIPPIGRTLWLAPPAGAIGVAFVALVVWTPSYFVEVHGLSVSRSGLFSAFLPAIAIVVTVLIGRWFQHGEGPGRAGLGSVLLAVTALALAVVPWTSGLTAGFVAIAAATALVSAASSVVLGLFSQLLNPVRVAFVGGIFVLVFNLGGGLASPLVGRLVEQDSWNLVFGFLAGTVLLGAGWTAGWYAWAVRKGMARPTTEREQVPT